MNSSLSCEIITSIMKHILILLFLMIASASMCLCQSEVPGQNAFENAFGTSVELDYELCCFAEYGWHNATEIKFEGITPVALESDDVAVELLMLGIEPQPSEQYFTTPNGKIVVVARDDVFKKILSRYLINLNSSN